MEFGNRMGTLCLWGHKGRLYNVWELYGDTKESGHLCEV